MVRPWARVWAIALGGLFVPLVGCTFLVQFDDADGGPDATAVVHKDAGKDSSVATFDSGPPHDATAPVDAEPDSSVETVAWHVPQGAPPFSQTLNVPVGCNPCAGVHGETYTCGSEHNADSDCGLDDSAIYLCDNESAVGTVGYECPTGQTCFPNGNANAICNPCQSGNDTSQYTTYTNSSSTPALCVTCNLGTAVVAVECPNATECGNGSCQQ